MTDKRYTIRQLGYASYADASTPPEALRLLAEAQDRLGDGARILIYDNELERDVTAELMEGPR